MFAHLFRESIGVSPYQLVSVRLERARVLLVEGRPEGSAKPPVGRAIQRLSHFINEFKRRHPVTSREYAVMQKGQCVAAVLAMHGRPIVLHRTRSNADLRLEVGEIDPQALQERVGSG